MTSKTIEQKYKKLTDLEHVLLRPARYLGAVSPHTALAWVYNAETNKMVQEEITYNPALIKMLDEIVSNSVDHSKLPEGKNLTVIKISVDRKTGTISVNDNGGIPVVKHKEHDQFIPEMIFGELRSGSNFDDDVDSELTGQNGEGSSLVNIFSTKFIVDTCDGKNRYVQEFTKNNHVRSTPVIKGSTRNGTTITFTPDYERIKCVMDDGNFKKIQKRLVDVAGCNPKLKVYFNDELITVKSFKDYVELYTSEYEYDENDKWRIAIAHSDEGFQHVSFVNGTESPSGGTHVEYIANQLAEKLREYFKKKHKVDIRPSEIKNHVRIFIDATIVRPRYDSQTKEKLITEVKDFKSSYELPERVVKKLIGTTIIQSVLDWVAAKEAANEKAKLRAMNKDIDKSNPKDVAKFHDATTKNREDAILFLVEGDSALNGILAGRDTKTMGAFPLRGKPMNVSEMEVSDLTKKKKNGDPSEFENILRITGLQLGVEVKSLSQIRFGRIVPATDQDLDGYSIRGLLMNMFYTFWPELFEMGVIYVLNTPIVKVKYKKEILRFYNLDDFEEWKVKHPNERYESQYLKGLGSSDDAEWISYLSQEELDKNLIQIKLETQEDRDMFKLIFSKGKDSADNRKEWLQIEEK